MFMAICTINASEEQQPKLDSRPNGETMPSKYKLMVM